MREGKKEIRDMDEEEPVLFKAQKIQKRNQMGNFQKKSKTEWRNKNQKKKKRRRDRNLLRATMMNEFIRQRKMSGFNGRHRKGTKALNEYTK